MQQNKIYVGNFPYTVDESQLRDIFASYGEIEEIALIKDRETGRPRGSHLSRSLRSSPRKKRWNRMARTWADAR
jgi:hypothetical protein